MAGGLSESAMGRLEALEDGEAAVGFLASLVARGRSSYTVRTYARNEVDGVAIGRAATTVNHGSARWARSSAG
jgi:hypothetical protein